MKLALIGHGAMGRLIERMARDRGHEIGVVIDDARADASAGELAGLLRGCDAAIDFTHADAVVRNLEACVLAGVPLVEGTTGWEAERQPIEHRVIEGGGALVYGANFSIGVNLFYKVVRFAAELVTSFPDYEVFIEEQHHSRKKDAPSGTALTLKRVVEEAGARSVAIVSTRAGNIPGTHRVGFDGPWDQILLEHSARSRDGFAAGALMAAEWAQGKRGVFEFSAILDEILGSR